jgi:hypothetical protein
MQLEPHLKKPKDMRHRANQCPSDYRSSTQGKGLAPSSYQAPLLWPRRKEECQARERILRSGLEEQAGRVQAVRPIAGTKGVQGAPERVVSLASRSVTGMVGTYARFRPARPRPCDELQPHRPGKFDSFGLQTFRRAGLAFPADTLSDTLWTQPTRVIARPHGSTRVRNGGPEGPPNSGSGDSDGAGRPGTPIAAICRPVPYHLATSPYKGSRPAQPLEEGCGMGEDTESGSSGGAVCGVEPPTTPQRRVT